MKVMADLTRELGMSVLFAATEIRAPQTWTHGGVNTANVSIRPKRLNVLFPTAGNLLIPITAKSIRVLKPSEHGKQWPPPAGQTGRAVRFKPPKGSGELQLQDAAAKQAEHRLRLRIPHRPA